MTITILLCFFCIANLVGCNKEIDYSNNKNYAHLFTESDDDATKELKNCIISQIVSYNKGDAKSYYAHFQMEKNDRDFNIAEFKSLWNKYTLSYQIETLECAFLDETNAQVLLSLHAHADNRTDGAELYDYIMDTVYTMEKQNGTWKIITQSDSQIVG